MWLLLPRSSPHEAAAASTEPVRGSSRHGPRNWRSRRGPGRGEELREREGGAAVALGEGGAKREFGYVRMKL
jgi:hypothetical protein